MRPVVGKGSRGPYGPRKKAEVAPTGKRGKQPNGAVLALFAECLTEAGRPLRSGELREAIDRKQPSYLAGRNPEFLAGRLAMLVDRGHLTRSGERGSYQYGLAGDMVVRKARGGPLPRDVIADRERRAAKLERAGLCARNCGKPRVAGKRLCRAHLRTIQTTQKLAAAARGAGAAKSVDDESPRQQLSMLNGTNHGSVN
jgi:hypothetical protein